MSGRILVGKPLADQILVSVTARATELKAHGIVPRVVFVAIGETLDGQMYVEGMERLARPTGIEVARQELPADVELSKLRGTVVALNADPGVDGIIVQMPLPAHLVLEDLATLIDPRKDVDGVTVESAGRLYLAMPAHRASTAVAIVELLTSAGIQVAGSHAVVVGRSQVVGHPLAELLLRAHATVTVTHSKTVDLATFTRSADILCVAAGKPRLVTADMICAGVAIVDAGINVGADGLVGDVDFDGCLPLVSLITPVPGGVGPVTNAVLLRNVVDSAERRFAAC